MNEVNDRNRLSAPHVDGPQEEGAQVESSSVASPPPEPTPVQLKTISEAKLAANRRNAQRSTGPRTPRGKANSRSNAHKHSLLATGVVIGHGPGQESRAEFDRLLRELQADLAPVGRLEMALVEQIAVCLWRLRRVYRYEEGEIRSRLNTEGSELIANVDQVDPVQKALLELRMPNFEDLKEFEQVYTWSERTERQRRSLRWTTAGVRFLSELLQQVRAELANTGSVGGATERKLFAYFGADQGGIARTVSQMRRPPAESAGTGAALDQSAKGAILVIVDKELESLGGQRAAIKRHEQQLTKAKLAKFSLPPPQITNQLLRYETSIQRELYRAIHELERLQRRRGGEYVPPPVEADVNVAR